MWPVGIRWIACTAICTNPKHCALYKTGGRESVRFNTQNATERKWPKSTRTFWTMINLRTSLHCCWTTPHLTNRFSMSDVASIMVRAKRRISARTSGMPSPVDVPACVSGSKQGAARHEIPDDKRIRHILKTVHSEIEISLPAPVFVDPLGRANVE